MRVLGIDPGTAITGYGLIDHEDGEDLQTADFGVIRTPAKMELAERLVLLYDDLENIILLHKPQSAAVEKLFFSKNVKTALSVGHARGIVLYLLAKHKIPISEYTPNEIKQAITGYGNADKKQMQTMTQVMLNLDETPQPDDAADALATAICHINTSSSWLNQV